MIQFDELYNKSVLITGATGMIGQNVVKLLLDLNSKHNANISVIAHARSEEKLHKIFSDIEDDAHFSTILCDISDIEYTGSIDYIVHTAGVTGGSKQHVDYPLKTINTSIDGTRQILNLAVEKQVKGVVLLSSLEVYGVTNDGTRRIKETDGGYINTMNPRSSYSEGKRIAECLFTAYASQCHIPAMVARLTASFGSGASFTDKRVFAQFAKSIIDGEDIVLKSSGETVRNYCDVMDVATALVIILLKGVPGNAYNVANMEAEISIRDLAQRFINNYPESGSRLVFDTNCNAEKLGYNPVMHIVLDSEKLMKLGWQPQYSIDDMICHLIESYKHEKKEQIS